MKMSGCSENEREHVLMIRIVTVQTVFVETERSRPNDEEHSDDSCLRREWTRIIDMSQVTSRKLDGINKRA
jgi:hypothetical protein